MIREDQHMESSEESSYDKVVVPFIFKDIGHLCLRQQMRWIFFFFVSVA